MRKWTTIALPNEMVKIIDAIIKERSELGYSSRAEFVKESVRMRLEQINIRREGGIS